MTIERPVAARLLMTKLAQQPDLYGLWLEPEWRAVWNAITAIAAEPTTQESADPLPRQEGRRVTFLHEASKQRSIPAKLQRQTHSG